MIRITGAPHGEVVAGGKRVARGDERHVSKLQPTSHGAARTWRHGEIGVGRRVTLQAFSYELAILVNLLLSLQRCFTIERGHDGRCRAIEREEHAGAQSEHVAQCLARYRLRNAVELGKRVVRTI